MTPARGDDSARPAVPGHGSRRLLTVVVLLAVVGAALLLLAESQHWLTIQASRPAPLPSLDRRVTGGTAEPALRALGLVDLAGAVALLATRRVGRRIVGVLLASSGVLGAVLAARDVAGVSDGRARGLLAPDGGQVIGLDAGSPLRVGTASGWVVLAVAASVVVAGAGVVAVLWGGRMPMMGAKYDAPVGHGSQPIEREPDGQAGQTEPTGRAGQVDPTDRGLWDALDRGDDPTAQPPPSNAEAPSATAADGGRRSRPERAG